MVEATGSPALPSASSKADLVTFVGRTEELELIRQLLVGGRTRLLTLTGPAGVGKTRLALEAGRRYGCAFPNGVWFVDLTTTRDQIEVPSGILKSLGLPDIGAAPLHERLFACL